MNLHCNAIQAVADSNVWREYVDGHAQVLRDFGIEVLTSYGEEWIKNPNVYLITMANSEGKLVGGIKVHKVHQEFQLPVEYAISELASEIHTLVREATPFGCGEICGLWISKDVGKRGLAHFLTKVAIAICQPLRIQKIFGISSPFTLNMFYALGYEKISGLGNKGDFFYPTPEFISTAVQIVDTFDLPLALIEHKSRIFSLRNSPIQIAQEEHQSIVTSISYNLSAIFT